MAIGKLIDEEEMKEMDGPGNIRWQKYWTYLCIDLLGGSMKKNGFVHSIMGKQDFPTSSLLKLLKNTISMKDKLNVWKTCFSPRKSPDLLSKWFIQINSPLYHPDVVTDR